MPQTREYYEVQARNLLNQARSATCAEFERVKRDMRDLVRAAFDAGLHNSEIRPSSIAKQIIARKGNAVTTDIDRAIR